MTDPSVLIGLTAKAVSQANSPSWLRRAVGVATLAVAQSLVRLVSKRVAEDFETIRKDLVRSSSVPLDKSEAESQKLLAEAAETQNRAARARRDVLKRAQARKVNAEAEQLELENRARRSQAVLLEEIALRLQAGGSDELGAAFERLSVAARRLSSKGGKVIVDEQALTRFLSTTLPDHAIEPKGDD